MYRRRIPCHGMFLFNPFTQIIRGFSHQLLHNISYRNVAASHKFTDTEHSNRVFTTCISFLKTNRQNSPSHLKIPLRRKPRRRKAASFLPFGRRWAGLLTVKCCGCLPTPCGRRSASAHARKMTGDWVCCHPPSTSLKVPRT